MGVDRRSFIMTTLMTGFTASVARARSAPIHTDSDGLADGEARIEVADGHLPAYFARPAGSGPFPTIVVIEEIFGVHEYIKDVCRRFAKRGYLAVAPELYARLADLSTMSDPQAIIRDVIMKAPDATVLSDLDSTVAWASAHGGDTRRLGVNGFCRGGRDTWLYAEHNSALKAAVAWYGPVRSPVSPIQPRTPIDAAGVAPLPLARPLWRAGRQHQSGRRATRGADRARGGTDGGDQGVRRRRTRVSCRLSRELRPGGGRGGLGRRAGLVQGARGRVTDAPASIMLRIFDASVSRAKGLVTISMPGSSAPLPMAALWA